MTRRLFLLLALLCCVGCSSLGDRISLALRSHSFEPQLYVVRLSVPHLQKSEWVEIEAQYAVRTDYVLRRALVVSATHVRVDLALKSDQYKGMELTFVRRSDHWIEEKSKAKYVDFMIPFKNA
jgi:hypothetical protein